MLERVTNWWLVGGAILSFSAALAHIGVIIVGPSWYRLFGAGESMARQAEAGSVYPGLITFGIASVLAVWGMFALSGAGVLPPFPLLKWGLLGITSVYLLRGLIVVPAAIFDTKFQTSFWLVSSSICTGFGIVHFIGLWKYWSDF